MTLETRIRDNLAAAGDALVVPEPRHHPVASPASIWRRPLAIVVAAAVVTVALVALPVILINPDVPGSEPLGTTVPTIANSAPPTTSPPPTSTTTPETSTTLPPDLVPLAEISTDSAQYQLWAKGGDLDEDQPAASVILWANSPDGSDQIDQAQVGESDGFLYNVVIGVDGVCSFTSEPGTDRVVVQMRWSASSGCSEPFVFELRDGSLVEVDANAEEISQLFIAAWQSADEATMSSLASREAVDSALRTAAPTTDPTFVSCEGAAGSVYCSYDDGGRTITIRVQNVESPPTVIEVRTG